MSTWVFINEKDELLTVPFLIKGEKFKRFVSSVTGAAYFVGKFYLSPKSQKEIVDEMTNFYKGCDEKRMTEIKDFAELLISLINNDEYQKIAKACAGVDVLSGIKVNPVFAYSSSMGIFLQVKRQTLKQVTEADTTTKTSTLTTTKKEAPIKEKVAEKTTTKQPAPKKQKTVSVKKTKTIKKTKVEEGETTLTKDATKAVLATKIAQSLDNTDKATKAYQKIILG